jgi:hypothetical protein
MPLKAITWGIINKVAQLEVGRTATVEWMVQAQPANRKSVQTLGE